MADPITKTIIVKSDVATAYNLWANFENFPHFMKYIERVHQARSEHEQVGDERAARQEGRVDGRDDEDGAQPAHRAGTRRTTPAR